MKKICLCFKIHIPAIHTNYRFFNINKQHQYCDETRLKNQLLKVYSGNLQPFFETFKNISSSNGDKFKAAISISGITLSLFKRFVPKAIELLNELKQNYHIEFLSESWSNSILAHVSNRLMIRQIMMHDAQMKSTFGVIPDVFIVHSPISSPELFNTIFDCGKKTILTYSNHIHQLKSIQRNNGEIKQLFEKQVYLINYKASQALNEIDLNLKMKSFNDLHSMVNMKVKRNVSVSLPQTIIINPGDIKKPFKIGDSIIWKKVFSHLLTNQKIRFMLPSELENDNPANMFNSLIEETGNYCKLPDFWMKNNLQKDAFNRQLAINNMMPSHEIKSKFEEWEFIHDMEYLYFMDNRFFGPKFLETHYNPFSSPYLSYINYMNVLDDFSGMIAKQNRKVFKKRSVQTEQENIIELLPYPISPLSC